MVKNHELKGYNILANDKLIGDLAQKTSWRSGLPRFMIIDQNGKIINDNAMQPQNKEELSKLLEAI